MLHQNLFKLIVWLQTIFALHIDAYQQLNVINKYPCDYSKTINITDGLRLKDGSYSYQGILVPANMTAMYTYKMIDGIEYSAPQHVRGCACHIKPCITFCCPPDYQYDVVNQNCTELTIAHNQRAQHAHLEIITSNISVKVVNIHESFVIRYEFGCKKKYIDKKNKDFWEWSLYSNGTLWRDNQIWSPDEYCFTPLKHKNVWSLQPLICERFQRGFRKWIYVICASIAVSINFIIFLLLISVESVRNNNYGESIIFYLASMIIALVSLIYLTLNNPSSMSQTACRNIGFIAYMFLIVAFLLLSIASWDFYYTFHSRNLGGWRRKLLYGVATALAYGMKNITKSVQDSNISKALKPGIGEGSCWFDVRLWGIMYYYYTPIFITFIWNIFFCSKAYFKLLHLPKDTLNVSGCDLQTVKKKSDFQFLRFLHIPAGSLIRLGS